MKIHTILLVEDNAAQVNLLEEAWEDTKCDTRLDVTSDGEKAMDFLRKRGSYHHADRPNLILLDLHLPKMGGYEVLKEIKSDPELSQIPIIVFTSSDNTRDLVNSYALNVKAYVQKPTNFDKFKEFVNYIEDFLSKSAETNAIDGYQKN